jgi:hypothetical protein
MIALNGYPLAGPLFSNWTSSFSAAYSIKIGNMVQVRKWGMAQAPADDTRVWSSHYDLPSSARLGYKVGRGYR